VAVLHGNGVAVVTLLQAQFMYLTVFTAKCSTVQMHSCGGRKLQRQAISLNWCTSVMQETQA
jgi:hypothetical protein